MDGFGALPGTADQTARATAVHAAFDGTVAAVRLHEGFGIHTLDATARQSFETSAVRAPGVILHCFLEGETEARLSGRSMELGRAAGAPARLILTATHEPEPFWRRSRPGEYVRKVNINLSHDWLDAHGLTLQPDLRRTVLDLGRADIEQFERLAGFAGTSCPIARLDTEALTLSIVARTFARLAQDRSRQRPLAAHDMRRLRRMEAYIHNRTGPLPRLAEVAREGGVSLSTLRRLFHEVHECSVQDYIRKVRLEDAHIALTTRAATVAEAACIAGYSTPENFSTAYRRAFGTTPSRARRH